MSKTNVSTVENLLALSRNEREVMSISAYLEMVRRNPQITRDAHVRMYDAIVAKGVSGEGDARTYGFFADQIFGIDDALRQVVDYFAAAAHGMDIRRRMLMLLGPPGSAKSNIVTLLKRGYEEYARTNAGAMYGIVGCPHHEEPVHAIPERLRRELGTRVEGSLCPYCRIVVDDELGGDIARLQVERIYPDEDRRVAIGSITPQDPLSQTMDELIGSMDLAKLPKYGSESDPRAYRFDGAINAASRGILDVVEGLKLKSELMFSFLTLAQERQVKAGRFELFFVDEILITHTNLAEFTRFAADQKNEAIQNRLFIVRVPYNLALDDEVRIYQKLLAEANMGVHIAPGTLKAAARWTLLSRYTPSDKYTPKIKLALYNREYKGEYTDGSYREMRRLSPEDGMSGVSPRQTIDAISMATARKSVPCATPVDIMRSMKETIANHVGQIKKEDLEGHVATVREMYDTEAEEEVERAFVFGFDDIAQQVVLAYLDNAEATLNKTQIQDPITGEEVEPDLNLLHSIENEIDVRGPAALEFRREILAKVGELSRRGETFRWNSHEGFRNAIQKHLFKDVANIVKITTSAKTPDPEQKRKIDLVTEGLKEEGYCEHCAAAILQYVGQRLHK